MANAQTHLKKCSKRLRIAFDAREHRGVIHSSSRTIMPRLGRGGEASEAGELGQCFFSQQHSAVPVACRRELGRNMTRASMKEERDAEMKRPRTLSLVQGSRKETGARCASIEH